MASRRPQAGASHRLVVTVCPLDLWWMLPSVWVLALKHEERVQKAFSVDHHGPGDARLSHGANGVYRERGDTVPLRIGVIFKCSEVVHEIHLNKRPLRAEGSGHTKPAGKG